MRGALRVTEVPSPIWPWMLSPQQRTVSTNQRASVQEAGVQRPGQRRARRRNAGPGHPRQSWVKTV